MRVDFIPGMVKRPEFGEMFGGWFMEHDNQTFMVDCGVGDGAKDLVERLAKRLGGRNLDYVLLTHIHLDHAGGLREIIKRWPLVKIIAHEKGIPYLLQPGKLWTSTQKVMRELAEMYGQPSPLYQPAFIPHTQARVPGLDIFETPGHAQHHLSFRLAGSMFVGEAGGVPHIINGRLCNRPGTPPRYFVKEGFESIDLLLRENDEMGYFAHTHELLPYRECLSTCKTQLHFWLDFLKSPDAAPRTDESRREYLARMTDRLFWEDPFMRPLNSLPPMDVWREKFFMQNSVEGLVKHLEAEAKAS